MFENRYSGLDRAIHSIAFSTYEAQAAIAELEDRIHATRLKRYNPERPVFVTGLPRAGTTLLLECLAQCPELASHRYSDMPFVLIPLFWNRVSRNHRGHSIARERAHGDGMKINVESPEALEEVLWKVYWKQHYLVDRIRPWGEEEDGEFLEFFRNHMRKIIYLRRGHSDAEVRYVSKNNLNIARLPALCKMFPHSMTIVPFRNPVQHAVSLLRQHQNFLAIQDEDPFALKYMSAVGHFDFGRDLRPIDFDGWLGTRSEHDPTSLKFWIEYWIAAYRHILYNSRNKVVFVCYESLCASATTVMCRLGERVGIKDTSCLTEGMTSIHQPVTRDLDLHAVPANLIAQAEELYSSLLSTAI